MSRAVGTALVLLLALAGCGSQDGITDQDRVDAGLLRLSDFPPDQGWTVEAAATDDPAEADFDAAVDACEERHDPTADARSANRDSDSFTRGEFVLVASNASVVAEEGVRDELFGALDALVDCFGTALEEALTKQAGEGVTLTVSDPYPVDVSTAADRTEGRAIQLGIDPASIFIDVIAVEQGSTLLFGAFMHQGELTLDDEEQILAPAVERMKDQ